MSNNGLSKRCKCKRSRWVKCKHPWHAHVKYRGRDYKLSLHRWLELPSDYEMNRQEAKKHLDKFRVAVREGKIAVGKSQSAIAADTALTFGAFCDLYIRDHVERPEHSSKGQRLMKWHIKTLRTSEVPAADDTLPLEQVRLKEISRPHIEAVRRAAHTRAHNKGGRVGANRLLARLRAMLAWALDADYITETPFRKVKLDRTAESNRTRRLHVGEEQKLLDAADDHTRLIITAALHTGCRKDELLDLQWYQVSFERNLILIPAEKSKSKRARQVPMTAKLRGLLEMKRIDPLGREFSPDAYVFGNAVGERTTSFRKQWDITRLVAHGHQPSWKGGRLTNESREQLVRIDLHFHDLRRECASRLVEAGVSVTVVRDWLGHVDITTTNRYLASDTVRLQEAVRALESREATDPLIRYSKDLRTEPTNLIPF